MMEKERKTQMLDTGIIYIANLLLKQSNKAVLYYIPLSFGVDTVIQHLRFTYISNKYFLGFVVDTFHFVGVGFEKPFNINLISQNFPAYQAQALLKFDYNLIWQNIWFSVLIFPLAHILFGILLGFVLTRFPKVVRNIVIVILIILLSIYFIDTWQSNPRAVVFLLQ